jgi:condensin complex subunit 2
LRDFKFSTSDAGNEDYPDFFENDNDNVDELDELDDLNMNDDVSVDEDDRISHINRRSTKDYVMAMVDNENGLFSYFDSAFLRNWSGPEHWKIKRAYKSN